jgi:hypothetical protein
VSSDVILSSKLNLYSKPEQPPESIDILKWVFGLLIVFNFFYYFKIKNEFKDCLKRENNDVFKPERKYHLYLK